MKSRGSSLTFWKDIQPPSSGWKVGQARSRRQAKCLVCCLPAWIILQLWRWRHLCSSEMLMNSYWRAELAAYFMLVSWLASTLKMEMPHSSETLADFQKTTRRFSQTIKLFITTAVSTSNPWNIFIFLSYIPAQVLCILQMPIMYIFLKKILIRNWRWINSIWLHYLFIILNCRSYLQYFI